LPTGQSYVIDVNPRFPAGGMSLSAVSGINLPEAVTLDLAFGPYAVEAHQVFNPNLRHYRIESDTFLRLPQPLA